jgi:hypothetical protein
MRSPCRFLSDPRPRIVLTGQSTSSRSRRTSGMLTIIAAGQTAHIAA